MDSDAFLLEKLKQYREYIFRSHAEYILESYLDGWINKIAPLRPIEPSQHTAIIIDDRPVQILRFSICNTLIMTRLKMKIILFTTQDSYNAMEALFKDLINWVKVIKLNDASNTLHKINTTNYNHILKNQSFWEKLPSKNILIFQTDALLIEPFDYSMFNYDYVGAPFSLNKYLSTSFPEYRDMTENGKVHKWVTQVFNRKVPIPDNVLIGNGGLSIRNRDVMIEICQNEYSPKSENEDIFFSRLIKKYSKKIVPFDIARRFSCECSYFKSIGSHASYFYLSQEEQAEIYERHIKHIFALINLPSNSTLISSIK